MLPALEERRFDPRYDETVTREIAARAVAFECEPCPMFTQRQNELLSQYMEAHGKIPPGVGEEDELDDLF